MDEISDTLLKQRLRNRIIEVLDMLSDSDDTIKKLGTDEAMECWFDFVDEEKIDFYDEPIFTGPEIMAIKELHQLIGVSYDSVPSTWNPSDVALCESWAKIVAAANMAFNLFQKRGFLDEESEIT